MNNAETAALREFTRLERSNMAILWEHILYTLVVLDARRT